MRDIYHNDKMRKLEKPAFKAVELRREMRSLSLGLGGGCPDGRDITRHSSVIVDYGDSVERTW